MLKCSYLDRELPVAAVEDVPLTKEELDLGMNSNLKSYSSQEILQYINDWVDQELLYQEAVRQNILATKDMEFELEKLRKAMLVNRFLKEIGVEKVDSKEMLKVGMSDLSDETQFVALELKQRNGG